MREGAGGTQVVPDRRAARDGVVDRRGAGSVRRQSEAWVGAVRGEWRVGEALGKRRAGGRQSEPIDGNRSGRWRLGQGPPPDYQSLSSAHIRGYQKTPPRSQEREQVLRALRR